MEAISEAISMEALGKIVPGGIMIIYGSWILYCLVKERIKTYEDLFNVLRDGFRNLINFLFSK